MLSSWLENCLFPRHWQGWRFFPCRRASINWRKFIRKYLIEPYSIRNLLVLRLCIFVCIYNFYRFKYFCSRVLSFVKCFGGAARVNTYGHRILGQRLRAVYWWNRTHDRWQLASGCSRPCRQWQAISGTFRLCCRCRREKLVREKLCAKRDPAKWNHWLIFVGFIGYL